MNNKKASPMSPSEIYRSRTLRYFARVLGMPETDALAPEGINNLTMDDLEALCALIAPSIDLRTLAPAAYISRR
jgi:hypothetical protein